MNPFPNILLRLVFESSVVATPGERYIPLAVYDDANEQVLLYGGATKDDELFTDLWALKGSSWKKLSDSGPSARIKGTFAYDASRKSAVLFGGNGSESYLNETWDWDGRQWRQFKGSCPPGRIHTISEYDRKNKVIIMFGGFGAGGVMNDTWAYDGGSWKQVDANGPKNVIPHGMTYNETTEKLILITSEIKTNPNDKTPATNRQWEWTGSSWKEVKIECPKTSANSLQAMAAFEKDGIVLFDGDDRSGGNGRTWKFSNGRWTSEYLRGPASRTGHVLVFDKSIGNTILFGGSDRNNFFGDVWVWDGKRWNEGITTRN